MQRMHELGARSMLINSVTSRSLISSVIVAEHYKRLSRLPAYRRLSRHVCHSSAATVGTQVDDASLR